MNLGGILHTLGVIAHWFGVYLALAICAWWLLTRPGRVSKYPALRQAQDERNLNGDGMDSDHAARLTPPVQRNSRAGGVLFSPTPAVLEGGFDHQSHHANPTTPQEPQHHGEC